MMARTVAPRWAVLALLPAIVGGQDMRENAVGCGDIHRTCEMNCLLPTYRKNEVVAWPVSKPESYVDIESCTSLCKVSRQDCVETLEAKNSLACLQTCTETYEAHTNACNQVIDDASKMTFGKNLDACSITAGTKMETCSSACYDKDVYHGWTPDTEEGTTSSSSSSSSSAPGSSFSVEPAEESEPFSIPTFRAKLKAQREALAPEKASR